MTLFFLDSGGGDGSSGGGGSSGDGGGGTGGGDTDLIFLSRYPVSVSVTLPSGRLPREIHLQLSHLTISLYSVSDQPQVLINKLSGCPLNIGETINSQNQFNVNEVQVHHHNQIHNEQHVYQDRPRITNNTYNTFIIMGDQRTSQEAVQGIATTLWRSAGCIGFERTIYRRFHAPTVYEETSRAGQEHNCWGA